MAGALIWRESDQRYLLLRRADHRDIGAGEWECVTGRLEQGESLPQALQREVCEEVGINLQIECILRTTHFYRGEKAQENEVVGVLFGCSTDGGASPAMSEEHSAFAWVTGVEAQRLLAEDHWLLNLIARADAYRRLTPEEARQRNRAGFQSEL
jgi:8-oxo-dGTP diphosphatase